MVGIVLVSHGSMAEGMLSSIGMLRGGAESLQALCLYPDTATEMFSAQLAAAVDKADEGDGVIVLADINGGTPARLSVLLSMKNRAVEVIAGMSLPVVLELLCSREEESIDRLCEHAVKISKHCTAHISKSLRESLGGEKREQDELDSLMN